MAFWKKKEESIIDQHEKIKRENQELERLRQQDKDLQEKRVMAEERQKLRSNIKEHKSVVQREKYRHLYAAKDKLASSAKKGGKIGGRLGKNLASPEFGDFLFGTPRTAAPRRRRPSRRRPRQRKKPIWY